MNKEQTAISKTITQWLGLAETGGDKPHLIDVLDNCYLCEEFRNGSLCYKCPYYKKFGRCGNSGNPFQLWRDTNLSSDKRIYAKVFLEQVKTLQEKEEMNKEEKEQLIQQLDKNIEKGRQIIVETERLTTEAEDLKVIVTQLTEAEKPKLTYFDYGLDSGCANPFIIDGELEPIWVKSGEKSVHTIEEYPFKNATILGNLADEMEALQEPLEEFYIDGFHVQIHGKNILFGGKLLTKENATKLWKKTGRVIATLKK